MTPAISRSEIEAYIRQAAMQRGIDPEIALRVARSEGLNSVTHIRDGWQSTVRKRGHREPSYGPFQLLVGDGKRFPKGMGNDFVSETGLDPKDPSTVFAQVDFALDRATETGWKPWYGARRAGIADRAGLAGSRPVGIQSEAIQLAGAAPRNIDDPRFGALAPVPQSRPSAQSVEVASLNTQAPLLADSALPDDVQPLSYPINEAMNPLLSSMSGASRLARSTAPNVAEDVLQGPYERMRQHYSVLTGKDMPPINDMIAKQGTSREKKTPNSQHFNGKAIDFGVRDLDNFERTALAESAIAAGFKGIGFGKNILHVDVGAQRSWTYPGTRTWAGQPVSKWVQAANQGVPLDLVDEARGAPIIEERNPNAATNGVLYAELAPIPRDRPEAKPVTVSEQPQPDRGFSFVTPAAASEPIQVNFPESVTLPNEAPPMRSEQRSQPSGDANAYLMQSIADDVEFAPGPTSSPNSDVFGYGYDTAGAIEAPAVVRDVPRMERSFGPNVSRPQAPVVERAAEVAPSTEVTDLADAYAQMAETMGEAGVRSLDGKQTLDKANPDVTVEAEKQAPQSDIEISAPVAAPRPQVAPVVPQTPAVQRSNADRAVREATGLDFWSGRSNTGTATDGTELMRSADGTAYRYNPKYDHTQKVRADGVGTGPVRPGKIDFEDMDLSGGPLSGGGLTKRAKSAIPSRQELISTILGGGAGAVVAGPAGAAIGARVGRGVSRRENALTNMLANALGLDPTPALERQAQLASQQGFAAPYESGHPYPVAPASPHQSSGSGRSYREQRDISPRAADAVQRDGGAKGLY